MASFQTGRIGAAALLRGITIQPICNTPTLEQVETNASPPPSIYLYALWPCPLTVKICQSQPKGGTGFAKSIL
jgi:hypothetical protein